MNSKAYNTPVEAKQLKHVRFIQDSSDSLKRTVKLACNAARVRRTFLAWYRDQFKRTALELYSSHSNVYELYKSLCGSTALPRSQIRTRSFLFWLLSMLCHVHGGCIVTALFLFEMVMNFPQGWHLRNNSQIMKLTSLLTGEACSVTFCNARNLAVPCLEIVVCIFGGGPIRDGRNLFK